MDPKRTLTETQKKAILDSAVWEVDNWGFSQVAFTVPFEIRYEGASNSLDGSRTKPMKVGFLFGAKTPEEMAHRPWDKA